MTLSCLTFVQQEEEEEIRHKFPNLIRLGWSSQIFTKKLCTCDDKRCSMGVQNTHFLKIHRREAIIFRYWICNDQASTAWIDFLRERLLDDDPPVVESAWARTLQREPWGRRLEFRPAQRSRYVAEYAKTKMYIILPKCVKFQKTKMKRSLFVRFQGYGWFVSAP